MIKKLSEIQENETAIFGGKAVQLARMIQEKFSVPPGFALSWDHEVNDAGELELLKAYDELDAQTVAVRSSGSLEDSSTASFAGIFKTNLGVTRDTLLDAIEDCFSGIKSPRVEEYLKFKNISLEEVKLGIVVQKMLDPEVAGVTFTTNPVTQDNQNVLVEAIYGLGEAIVSGEVSPDRYIINKASKRITDKVISSQESYLKIDDGEVVKENTLPDKVSNQKISDEQIKEVAQTSQKLEEMYHQPVDIEWAYENGQLYILQVRPVTT